MIRRFKRWRHRRRRDRFYRELTETVGRPMLSVDMKRPGWIERPLDWPEWSDESIKRFYGP